MQFRGGFGILQVPACALVRVLPACVPQDVPRSLINQGCPAAKCGRGHVHLLRRPPYSVYVPSLEVSWDGEGALPRAAALPCSPTPAVQ